MLNKLERYIHRICEWFEWIGIAGMLLMMVITCIDVVGAKAFKLPFFGALDIVMLSQILAISFGAGMTLIMGRHIQVEYFFNYLPYRVQYVINIIIPFIGFVLFILIIWRLGDLGYSFQTSGEYSATAYIPLYPFAYGAAIASIPVFLVLLLEFLKSLTRRVQK